MANFRNNRHRQQQNDVKAIEKKIVIAERDNIAAV